MGRVTRRQLTDLPVLGLPRARVRSPGRSRLRSARAGPGPAAERPVRPDCRTRSAAGSPWSRRPAPRIDVTGPGPATTRARRCSGSARCATRSRSRRFDGDLTPPPTGCASASPAPPGYQVTGTELAVATGAGLAGLQGGYTAPGRGGRYAGLRRRRPDHRGHRQRRRPGSGPHPARDRRQHPHVALRAGRAGMTAEPGRAALDRARAARALRAAGSIRLPAFWIVLALLAGRRRPDGADRGHGSPARTRWRR